MMSMNQYKRELTPTQLVTLAAAWQSGGCQVLGAKLAKVWPHFSVAEYGRVVKAVRGYLHDDMDYARNNLQSLR